MGKYVIRRLHGVEGDPKLISDCNAATGSMLQLRNERAATSFPQPHM